MEGLKATEAKAFLLKRSSSLEDFRWDTFGGIKWGQREGVETLMINAYMSHSQMLGKVESGGGPIFKVVLDC